jgi:hypothetical protein
MASGGAGDDWHAQCRHDRPYHVVGRHVAKSAVQVEECRHRHQLRKVGGAHEHKRELAVAERAAGENQPHSAELASQRLWGCG